MDTALATFLTALAVFISGVGGVIWTIYSGRKTLRREQSSAMFNEAVKIIEGYKEKDSANRNEIQALHQEIEKLTNRLAKLEEKNIRLEERNAWLVRSLAKTLNVPVNLVDVFLEEKPGGESRPPEKK